MKLSKKLTKIEKSEEALLRDLRELIINTRQSVAQAVNAALVVLHWKIGTRIRQEVLQGSRGNYGNKLWLQWQPGSVMNSGVDFLKRVCVE